MVILIVHQHIQCAQSAWVSNSTLPNAPSLYKTSERKHNPFTNHSMQNKTLSKIYSKLIQSKKQYGNWLATSLSIRVFFHTKACLNTLKHDDQYEIKTIFLDMKYKEMKVDTNIQREKWKTYKCTIMCYR